MFGNFFLTREKLGSLDQDLDSTIGAPMHYARVMP